RVCRTLREEGIGTPILMLTAKQGEYDEAEALDTGADDFLSKPFRQEELLKLLRARLGLELVYASNAAGSPASDNAPDGEIVVPPGAELAILRELAQRGDLRNLLAQVERLERADERYTTFTARLRDLAERFQLKKINELLAGVSSPS
ncbi:MAG: response regulator, partial [Anaerolineae bacterium]|nr:response regulator [Anaerolineae bacterium]